MRGEYKTKQRDLILDFIKKQSGHITVDSVVNHLGGKVGRTTVYRYLESLAESGTLLKYDTPKSSSTCYSFAGEEDNSFHFLCKGCGKVYHLDCDYLWKFSRHMQSDHGVNVDVLKTVIYGVCKKCNERKGLNA